MAKVKELTKMEILDAEILLLQAEKAKELLRIEVEKLKKTIVEETTVIQRRVVEQDPYWTPCYNPITSGQGTVTYNT